MAEPKLRFKQSDGSSYPTWEEVALGSVVSDNLDPVPTPKEGYRRVGIYCHAKGTFQEDVSAENALDVDTMYRIHKDNLIVNITFAWEHAVAIVKPEDEGLLVSHRFPEYSFNEGQVPGFYKYLILRPYFKNQLSLASPGGAGRNRVLNKTQFKEIIVTVPCVAEQRKIADFLSSVDEVIAASEAEVQNLEAQKKAVMKKIFSQEVRFKKEDGMLFPDWKNCHVFDVVEQLSSGKSVNSSSEIPGVNDVSVLKTSCVYHDIFNINERKKVVEDELMFVKCPLKKDNLIVSRMNTPEWVGACGYVYEEYSNVYLPDRLWQISISQDLAVALFVYELLVSPVYKRKIKDIASGTSNSMFNIAQNDFLRINIFLPCLEEQHLIADFLSDYDKAISSAKKELELWKKLKKGLLQQMFV